MFEEDMMVVYWKWLWLYCFCSSDCFMSFDCITNASFTAGECYVYWNVLQTGFWDQERLCVLRHKLAYCIATMRTWVVIRVYWPFQGPSPGMHCHILLWWYSSAWVLLKKKKPQFLISCSHFLQKWLLSHNSVFLLWQNYSCSFSLPNFLTALALIRAVFTEYFFFCVDSTLLGMWKRLSSHIQISASVDPENGCSTFPCPMAQTRLFSSLPGPLMHLNNHGSCNLPV